MFDHTADLGIDCSGRTMKELLENAGAVLVDLVIDRDILQGLDNRVFAVAGDDREELLVNFLRELLYLVNGEGFLPKTMTIVDLDEKELSCCLKGEPFRRGKHRLKREIKAVTYHAVSIVEDSAGMSARVVLDV